MGKREKRERDVSKTPLGKTAYSKAQNPTSASLCRSVYLLCGLLTQAKDLALDAFALLGNLPCLAAVTS